MFSSNLRTSASKIAQRASWRLHGKVAPTVSSLTSKSSGNARFISSEREAVYKEQGLLDDQNRLTFETMHEMNVRVCDLYADNNLFGTYHKDSNSFQWMTYAEYEENVHRARAVLKDLGVKEHGKVAIIANNRWEWATLAAAAYSLNAAFVPMYEAQLPSDWTYILNDSGSSVVFCATQSIYDRVQKEVLPSTPGVHASLCLDAPMGEPHAFATAMAAASPDKQGSLVVEPTPEDLANLIYTSGTTGKPKGVELTHNNSAFTVRAAPLSTDRCIELMNERDRTLSFLPWAHCYGQTCELFSLMSRGGSLGLSRGVAHILEDLQLVQPTILFSVPTLYKKVYDGVHNLIESASPVRKTLMTSALALGKAKADHEKGIRGPLGPMEKMQYNVLNRLVLSKIRDRFGGNLRYGYVAGSACAPEVLEFMDSLNIPVCEGYGLSETSPTISCNFPFRKLNGSVGKVLKDVQVLIIDGDGNILPEGEEGEICCVGQNVMRGYHNNPEATAEVISVGPDGKSRMFHTGDLGKLENGWLSVTGRLKEQYKLENGKYVVPTPIEIAIGMSRFIAQVVVCGANRPYNIALLVPEWGAIREEFKFGEDVTEEEMANDERVKALIDGEIASNCEKLKKFEIPNKWAFVSPFTGANNLLTPKMSIRRHKVMELYADLISGLYGSDTIDTQSSDGVRRAA